MQRNLFLCGALAFPLVACSRLALPDELRVGVPGWHAGLDPYSAPFTDVAERSWIYAQGLPALSTAKLEASGGRVRYQLSENVVWHDGKPLLAGDVREVFDRLLASHVAWKHTFPYDRVAALTVTGARSFVVELSRPTSIFARTFFAPYGNMAVPLIRRSRDALLGTAPFKIRYRHLERAAFDRVRGTGTFRSISMNMFDDQNSAAVAVASGEIDIALETNRAFVPAGVSQLGRRSGAVYVVANTTGDLRNRSVRAAILGEIDAASIARKAYLASPSDDVLPGVGIHLGRQKARSVGPVLRVAFARAPVVEKAAVILAESLRERGIPVKLYGWPPSAYEEALRAGDFDLAIWGGDYATLDDLAPDVRCADLAPAGHNVARLCDPTLDAALASDDSREVARRLGVDAVMRVLAPYYDYALVAPRLHLPTPRQPFVPWFADLERWTLS
ncbi:MAG TPA: ABC transporter substrate-binding protein [Candidatus Baltobacteraceae bacterium]|nr:ABC transporter substrate-binding protein [Candidatus Baltobacteraceae bacterium]